MTAESSSVPRRRRPLRLALLVLAVLLSVLVAASVVAYVRLDRSIKTFGAGGISKHRPPSTTEGQNVLLIGSDTRAGADGGLGGKGLPVGRSDTTGSTATTPSGTPSTPLPDSLTRDARSAATDPCTGISYGGQAAR